GPAAGLPAGWEPVAVAPGEMRIASFHIRGKDGEAADLTIVPLAGMAGGDLANLNRWRGQVSQPPVTEGELAKLAEPVQIAGQAGQLFDQSGANPDSGKKTRILAAVLRREGTAWSVEMRGGDELVAQQKPAFV